MDKLSQLFANEIDIAGAITTMSQSLPFLQGLSNIEWTLLISSVLFFAATFTLNGYILLRRYYINHRQMLVKRLTEKYEQLLIDYIFATKNEKETLFHAIKCPKKLDSSILLAQIILMKKNIKGQEATALIDLYEKLSYDKISYKKLHNLSWLKRLEGLQELAYMEALTDDSACIILLKDKHAIVRIMALKALIMNDLNWQKALVNYQFPLNKWEQVQICETINTNKAIGFTDCQPLLTSQNQTVVALVSWCEQLFTQLNPQELLSIKPRQEIVALREKELIMGM